MNPISPTLSGAIVAAIALALAGPATAGQQVPRPQNAQMQGEAMAVSGKDLYDQSGQRRGEIDKLVRNNTTDGISAVVDVGGLRTRAGRTWRFP